MLILITPCLYIFQDKVGSWFSNPGTGIEATSGGVGKYLKARNAQPESTPDSGLQAVGVAKKRKLGAPTRELKDFSAW